MRVVDPTAAVTFLTRVPLGRLARHRREDLAASALFFPLVGAALWAAAFGVAQLFSDVRVSAAVAVAVLAALTGALHLDALADTADALGGSSKEARLKIMRDHTLGSFGVAALSLTLLLEAAAISALLAADQELTSFAAVGAASRAIAPPLAAALPYARVDEARTAPAAAFTLNGGIGALAVGAATCLVAGTTGLLLLAAALLAAAAVGTWSRLALGGVTGDSLGAAIQLAELSCLIVLATHA